MFGMGTSYLATRKMGTDGVLASGVKRFLQTVLLGSCYLHVAVRAVSDGSLRLLYNERASANQGRVEVYSAEQQAWGTVCGEGWGAQEAMVVCRQLDQGDVLVANILFGNGSGPILSNVHCHEHDFHILDCEGSWQGTGTGTGPPECTHLQDVGVICVPGYHEEVQEGLTLWQKLIIVIGSGVIMGIGCKIITCAEEDEVDDETPPPHDDVPSVSAKDETPPPQDFVPSVSAKDEPRPPQDFVPSVSAKDACPEVFGDPWPCAYHLTKDVSVQTV